VQYASELKRPLSVLVGRLSNNIPVLHRCDANRSVVIAALVINVTAAGGANPFRQAVNTTAAGGNCTFSFQPGRR
jgi:hypothetical protein